MVEDHFKSANLHGSRYASPQTMVSTGSKHLRTTAFKTILPKFGSIGKSSKCKPISVSCSFESKASII